MSRIKLLSSIQLATPFSIFFYSNGARYFTLDFLYLLRDGIELGLWLNQDPILIK